MKMEVECNALEKEIWIAIRIQREEKEKVL